MKSIGLQPSDTGEPGGKETGQKMNHSVTSGGAFDKATASLLQEGFTLSWADMGVQSQVSAGLRRGMTGGTGWWSGIVESCVASREFWIYSCHNEP